MNDSAGRADLAIGRWAGCPNREVALPVCRDFAYLRTTVNTNWRGAGMMRKLLMTIVAAVLVAGAIGAWQATPIRVWWAFRDLRQASAEDREKIAVGFKILGESAVGTLLEGWKSADMETSRLTAMAFAAVASGLDVPASERALGIVRRSFDGYSIDGKRAALLFAAEMASKPGELSSTVAEIVSDLTTAAEKAPELQTSRLLLAGALVGRGDRWTNAGRTLALAALGDAEGPTRLAAVKVLLHAPLVREQAVLVRLAHSLRDPDPGVRRHSLVAVGEDRDAVTDEQLLPLLHDSDPEVQRLCEMSLRSRGLTDEHLRLAQLISDADPSVRIKVLPLLRQSSDLDRETWLRLLTTDPAPAIRAAAARAAGSVVPLRSRLAEMAGSDPSETVRDIARFWLDRSAVRRAGE
jgi:HEAT repeats